MNRLSREKSPYLRHSALQKIDWYPWSEEAFESALREDKPVFLSSGAIWCHWCHVMAKECFENEEIAKLLNENFISIKLDRDERPDIDRRYQQAINAMGAGSGWPLSVFLTPEKKPFFGGTYFPLEDRFGKPGFKRVLKEVAHFYKTKKKKIAEYIQNLSEFLKPKPLSESDLHETAVHETASYMIKQFDEQYGGFGSAPKFPVPGALEFLMNRFFFTEEEPIGQAVKKTLELMAKGGIHDQIGGGFHRYSVDEAWIVPHFEKMADDNAWHLRNYIDAHCVFGDEYFKEIAEGIINFIKMTLSDPDGGFYTSQDADVTYDDEGGYFTWTDEEFRRFLSDEEYKVMSLHLMNDKGAMHHDKSKKVLFISKDADEISRTFGMDIKKVNRIIGSGKKKLLKERKKRTAPVVDKTFYTSINGMLISSYLKAFRVLKFKYLKDFAIKSLERIMRMHFIHNDLFHTKGIKAVIDDYIYIIEALIGAFEITGDMTHLKQAEQLMNLCVEKFWDSSEGGFFDTDEEVLGFRLKGIEDIPHPSINSLGAILLMKLHVATGMYKYKRYAEMILRIFSSGARNSGVYAGYYFCALDAFYNLLTLTIHTVPPHKLAETALSTFRPYTGIVYGENKGHVIPCLREVCYEPINRPEGLKKFLSAQHKPDG